MGSQFRLPFGSKAGLYWAPCNFCRELSASKQKLQLQPCRAARLRDLVATVWLVAPPRGGGTLLVLVSFCLGGGGFDWLSVPSDGAEMPNDWAVVSASDSLAPHYDSDGNRWCFSGLMSGSRVGAPHSRRFGGGASK